MDMRASRIISARIRRKTGEDREGALRFSMPGYQFSLFAEELWSRLYMFLPGAAVALFICVQNEYMKVLSMNEAVLFVDGHAKISRLLGFPKSISQTRGW